MLDFTLNGTRYEVNEYRGGWLWLDLTHDEEAPSFFATAVEAQQDANKWEAGRDRREAEAEEDEREAEVLREEDRKEHNFLQWKRR